MHLFIFLGFWSEHVGKMVAIDRCFRHILDGTWIENGLEPPVLMLRTASIASGVGLVTIEVSQSSCQNSNSCSPTDGDFHQEFWYQDRYGMGWI